MNELKRGIYLLLIVIMIIFGLASRANGSSHPAFLAENAGDALWAAMVYFGFRFLFVRKSLQTAMLLSVLFSFGIEFSQLYQADWINQIRNTLLGALILGKGFLAVDLVRYTAGIIVAVFLDWCIFIRSNPRK
ncbi:DUF2809 domain-containing protein [Fictibacillus enclensis]|uniref:ribosomal maturation YjgA family protein n=1 Tax=Fictibacillus enclensis TaxID=1017270 RepID=UPI0033382C52